VSHNGESESPKVPRDVVEDESYTRQANTIQPDRRTLDDWLSGLIFVIATIPEEFDGVGNVRVAIHEGSRAFGIPGMMLAFRYTETLVTLLWIEATDDLDS
jgi:hypothetical protein